MANTIQEGDYVLVRHGSDKHAQMLRKHGRPTARKFLVKRVFPDSNAVEIDPRNTGVKKVISLRACAKAPRRWWVFDDGSTTAGRYEAPLTDIVTANGNQYECGGRLYDDDAKDEQEFRDELDPF